jgi:proline dehydrogenase
MATWLDRFVVRTLPLVPRGIVRRFSARYIAGATLDEALAVIRSLNAEGFMATLDILGEDVTRADETEQAVGEYREALSVIGKTGVDANISVKPTQLGLKLDPALCLRNFQGLCEAAREKNIFVRLDMEDTSCTGATVDLCLELREQFENVGVAIQAYLRRSFGDVQRLARARVNVRLCKGIYVEPRSLAFKDPAVINRSYIELLDHLLSSGCYVGIATHDERLVFESERIVRRLGLTRKQYEFQMLLGVDQQLREIIRDQGHRLRVYIPYGRDWYAYSTRRLKENPALASHIIRSFWRRNGR